MASLPLLCRADRRIRRFLYLMISFTVACIISMPATLTRAKVGGGVFLPCCTCPSCFVRFLQGPDTRSAAGADSTANAPLAFSAFASSTGCADISGGCTAMHVGSGPRAHS